MRILGIDIGTVRIGVALSDAMGWTAQPLEVIRRTRPENDLDRLAELAALHDVEEIVIGLPYNMNGSAGPMAALAREFALKMQERLGLPVREWDERLSSAAAERALLEGDVRRNKRKQVIDKVAAAIILQGYLDHKAGAQP